MRISLDEWVVMIAQTPMVLFSPMLTWQVTNPSGRDKVTTAVMGSGRDMFHILVL